jgi:septin family protein
MSLVCAFVFGKTGTGKTTFLRKIFSQTTINRQELEERFVPSDDIDSGTVGSHSIDLNLQVSPRSAWMKVYDNAGYGDSKDAIGQLHAILQSLGEEKDSFAFLFVLDGSEARFEKALQEYRDIFVASVGAENFSKVMVICTHAEEWESSEKGKRRFEQFQSKDIALKAFKDGGASFHVFDKDFDDNCPHIIGIKNRLIDLATRPPVKSRIRQEMENGTPFTQTTVGQLVSTNNDTRLAEMQQQLQEMSAANTAARKELERLVLEQQAEHARLREFMARTERDQQSKWPSSIAQLGTAAIGIIPQVISLALKRPL